LRLSASRRARRARRNIASSTTVWAEAAKSMYSMVIGDSGSRRLQPNNSSKAAFVAASLSR